ncbi:MAG: sugar phosphotransferase, partial [Candidatus Krumholzibacteriia bacterium]
ERSARTAFLRGYIGERREPAPHFLPPRRDSISNLLTLFEIEKVFYELQYELHHRPDWVGIPLRRIRRLLDV